MLTQMAGRAERCESSQRQLSQANHFLQESRSEVNVLTKQASATDVKLAQARKRIRELEREVLTLSLAKIEEKRKGVLEGITSCRQQILATPVGQKFLNILQEELVARFLKSPTLLASLAGVMADLLDEGRRFLLQKHGLEDSNRKNDLDELLGAFAGPATVLGMDESLPTDHPWWIPALEKTTLIFTSASWDNPHLPAWRGLLYPVVPFP